MLCRSETTNVRLESEAQNHDVDLSEATRLEDQNVLEWGLDFATDWLKGKQWLGLKGYWWVTILTIFSGGVCASCCFGFRKPIKKGAEVSYQAATQKLTTARQHGITAAFKKNPGGAAAGTNGHGAPANGGVFVPGGAGAAPETVGKVPGKQIVLENPSYEHAAPTVRKPAYPAGAVV